MSRTAVFVDRDGPLNELVADAVTGRPESPLSPADVRLAPQAPAAIRRLRAAGHLVVCVTNQPAAAKGTVAVGALRRVHRRVVELLDAAGARPDGSRMCLHHPDGIVEGLAGGCACRKPAPGMLLDAAASYDIDLERSWMVGDSDADVEAGRLARCRAVLLLAPGSEHRRSGRWRRLAAGPGLDSAVARILDQRPRAVVG